MTVPESPHLPASAIRSSVFPLPPNTSQDYTTGLNELFDPRVWAENSDDPTIIDWPIPQPIDLPMPPVETMPEDILPTALEGWLCDIAYRKQVPLEFPTVTAIAVISSIVGNRLGIKPKEKDDWMEVPNLWGCIVGPPSMLKTPTIKDVLKPLEGLEKEAAEQHRSSIIDYKAKAERNKLELELIKKKGKGGTKSLDEVEEEIKEMMRDDELPTRTRYFSNDATIEKLGIILNENPKGIMVFRDELSGLLASWNKAGREQDRAFYLESWNGKGTFSVDRIGRPDLFVNNLCLSVFGGIQPGKLAGYFNDIGSCGNDGMFQRFQLSVFPDPVKRQYVDIYPSVEARDRAYQMIRKLVELDYVALGKKDPYTPIPYLHFTPDAQSLFREWMVDLEGWLESGELSPLLEEHFAKYRSLVPKLALIFHLVDYVGGYTHERYVPTSALTNAIRFADFLKSHATRIYSLFRDGMHYTAYELSKRIAKGELGNSFKKSDVIRKGWHLLDKSDKVANAIEELTSAHWLIEERRDTRSGPQGGRPEAPVYRINPYTLNFYKKA